MCQSPSDELRAAMELQQAGDLSAAESVVRELLRQVPHHDDVQFFLSGLFQQTERAEEAADLLREIIERNPCYVQACNNLAILLQQAGQIDEAIGFYRQALAAEPTDAQVRYNLATALCEANDWDAANELLAESLRQEPDEPRYHYAQACASQSQGKIETALQHFRRVVELDAGHADAMYGLATICHMQGADDVARGWFQQVLELQPDHAAASYMLAALRGEETAQPSAEFVESLFDSYAAGYDEHLGSQLDYQAPRLVEGAILAAAPEPKNLDLLDLGCGTGLFGMRVRQWCRSLTGVDLSSRMLQIASQRGCYDCLVEAEIIAYMEATPPGSFDLIAAVDVLSYLGSLDRAFTLCESLLREGGAFAFTVEKCEDAGDYRITRSGRYQHSTAYVRRLAQQVGWQVTYLQEQVLRQEAGQPCGGLVVVLTKGPD